MTRSFPVLLALLFLATAPVGAEPPVTQPAPGSLDGAEVEFRQGTTRHRYRLTALADTTPAPDPVPDPVPQPPLSDNDVPMSVFPLRGVAPCAVHAPAMDIPLASGSPITASYEFDFGDPDGRFNTLRGFNAAHVYDKPGKYTIQLRVVDQDGNETVARKTIEVLPSQRRTLYVSADGSDSNPGTSPDRPIRSIDKAEDLVGDDTVVLFRRGDVFTLTGDFDIRGSNVYVGAYAADDGAPDASKPVIRKSGKRVNDPIVAMDDGCVNVVIEDLAFDTTFTEDTEIGIPTAISPRGRNTVIRRCTFLNVGYAVNFNQLPRYVLIQDSEAPLETGMREYFAWVEGSDHVILGNSVANSTRQHIVRGSENFQRLLVAHNTFANLARGRAGDYKDTAKTTFAIQQSAYVYIANNVCTDGVIGLGPLGKGDGLKRPNYKAERTRMVVVENNRVHNASINAGHGVEAAMVRNNIVYKEDEPAFFVDGYDMTYERGVVDYHLLNNTAVNNGAKGQFLSLYGGARDLTVANNLYVAPNLTTGSHQVAVVYVQDRDLHAFGSIRNNVWPVPTALPYADGGYCYVWPKWSDSAGYLTPKEWNAMKPVEQDVFDTVRLTEDAAPIKGSRAIGHARPVKGVTTDIDGKPRTGNAWTAGAVEVAR